MSLFNILDSDDLKLWLSLKKNTNKGISNLIQYNSRIVSKIETIQFIYLKIIDFENKHFFEKAENRLYLNARESKIFEHYHKLLSTKLSSIQKLIEKEFVIDKDEKKIINFLHNKLRDDLKHISKKDDLDILEKIFIDLEKNLIEQNELINYILSIFNRFVGDKDFWDKAYYSLSSKNDIFYNQIHEKKKEIFSNWDDFLEKLLVLKSLIAKEILIVYGANISNDDLSNWNINLYNFFRDNQVSNIFIELRDDFAKYEHFTKEEHITLYHSSENVLGIFPLSESRYPSGFYVCRGDKKFSLIIKGAQTQIPLSLKTVEFKLPVSIFNKYFCHDNNYGNEKVIGSKEAYENSFYLPVSNYPLFNKYLNLRIIYQK